MLQVEQGARVCEGEGERERARGRESECVVRVCERERDTANKHTVNCVQRFDVHHIAAQELESHEVSSRQSSCS